MVHIANAAKRWAELVDAAKVARQAYWDASARNVLPDLGDGAAGMFERVRVGSGSDEDYDGTGSFKWVYSSAMGSELAGEDCTKDPLWIAQTEARKASIKANRAAGHARGTLLKLTRNAINRGEL